MTNTEKAFCLGVLATMMVYLLIEFLDPLWVKLLAIFVMAWPVQVYLERLQDNGSRPPMKE